MTQPITLTPRLTAVLAVARREAELAGEDAVRANHVASALIWEGESVAARILEELGAGSVLRERLKGGNTTKSQIHEPESAVLLSVGLNEAQRRGHGYLGTEHVLLALTNTCAVVRQTLDELGKRHEVQLRVGHFFEAVEQTKSDNE